MLVKILVDNIAGGTVFAANNYVPGNSCSPLCGEWGLSVYIEFEGNRYFSDLLPTTNTSASAGAT